MGILETGFESRSKILYFLKIAIHGIFIIPDPDTDSDRWSFFFKFLIEKKWNGAFFHISGQSISLILNFFLILDIIYGFGVAVMIALLVKETILFIFIKNILFILFIYFFITNSHSSARVL